MERLFLRTESIIQSCEPPPDEDQWPELPHLKFYESEIFCKKAHPRNQKEQAPGECMSSHEKDGKIGLKPFGWEEQKVTIKHGRIRY